MAHTSHRKQGKTHLKLGFYPHFCGWVICGANISHKDFLQAKIDSEIIACFNCIILVIYRLSSLS